MKKKKLFLWTLLLLILGMGGCFSSNETEKDNTPPGGNNLISILLTSDKSTIEADGIEKASFKAIGTYDDGKTEELKDISYYVNDVVIVGNQFKTDKIGEYTVKAKLREIESNTIKIEAIKTEVKLSEKSKIIDQDIEDKVEKLDKENNKIIFSTGADINYKKDDIIASGVSDKFPNGLLVKVDSVIEENGKKVVIFKKAMITDAIEQAKVNYSVKLKKSDLKKVMTNYRGITTRLDPERDFVYQINSVIYDEDGDENTTSDQIKLEGELSIDPGVNFDLDIGIFTINSFGFGVDTNISGNLKLIGNLHKTWNKEITLMSYVFDSITIDIAGFPIVITPSMDLIVGSNGDITGKVRYSMSEQATAEVKIGYGDNGWGGMKNLSNNFDFSQPEIDANANFKIYTGARLEVALYTDLVAAGYGKVLLYFRGEADINKDPWWSVYGGIEAVMGFDGLGLDPYEYTMPIYEQKVVSADYFNNGDGTYTPEQNQELEKGWAKKYKFYGNIPSMEEILAGAQMPEVPIMLLGYYDYNDVVSNGKNGFIAVASAPFQFSMLTNYDKDGNILFNKFVQVEVNGEDVPVSVTKIKKSNDGYILSGLCGEGLVIAKVNENGENVWGKVLPVDVGGLTLTTNLAQISSDKYIVSFGGSFIIFNSNGAIEKMGKMTYNAFPDVAGEEGVFVDVIGAVPVNGGYVVIGNVNRGVFIPQGVMAKYDENNNLLWDRHIIIDNLDLEDPSLATTFNAVVRTENAGFYLSGWAEEGGFIAKFNSDGNLIWNRVMNEIKYPFTDLEVVDGIGVIGMTKMLLDEGYATGFIKFSSDGVYGWSKEVTGTGKSVEINGIYKRDDNKMISAAGAVGTVTGDGYTDKNPMLLSITPNGEMEMQEDSELTGENFIRSVITNWGFKTDVGIYEISDLTLTPEDATIKIIDCRMELVGKY